MTVVFRILRAPRSACFLWIAFAIAVCALNGDKAHANCGDYLRVRTWRGGEIATMPFHVAQSEPMPNQDSRGRRPCEGPSCDQGEPLPVSPTAAVSSHIPDKFLAQKALLPEIAFDLRHFLGQCRDLPSAGHPFRIKRPPRV